LVTGPAPINLLMAVYYQKFNWCGSGNRLCGQLYLSPL